MCTTLYFLSIAAQASYEMPVTANIADWILEGSATIIVPDNYTTIQAAISAASPGSTIFVREGTYYEHVVIDKTVSLVGEYRDSTIIDGNGTGTIITVSKAINASIYGFTIRNSGTNIFNAGVIMRDGCEGCIIRNNKITNNNDGIVLQGSHNNVVSGNIISLNSHDGITFYFSDNNAVFGNTIASNDNIGVGLLYYGMDNLFYHNNFILNTVFIEENQNITSFWNHDGEGNYWSGYAGADLDRDGIGDSSYVINSHNQDDYPLMGTFSSFSVTSKGQTHNITTISNSTISNFRFEIGAETGSKIIRFTVTGKNGTIGFCRVKIPTVLMSQPYVVLVDSEETSANLLNVSNEQFAYLYFSYVHSSYTVTIISPKALNLYNELLEKYDLLRMYLDSLNATYHDLLGNYSFLFGNHSLLQKDYHELNSSYLEHLQRYSESEQNIQSLTYIFAVTTAIFIITTVYLSKNANREEQQ